MSTEARGKRKEKIHRNIPYSEENIQIKKCLQSLGYNVAFQNNKTFQQYLSNVKDEIPKLHQSGIYKITCPILDKQLDNSSQGSKSISMIQINNHAHECSIVS